MASMRDRLIDTLAVAGIPVDTVVGEGEGTEVTYLSYATQSQIDAGNSLLASFDWSDIAHRQWLAEKSRSASKAALRSTEAVPRAARGGSYALMLSLQECRAKVNEIITWANLQGASIELLVTGDTLNQALAIVDQMIDAEIV